MGCVGWSSFEVGLPMGNVGAIEGTTMPLYVRTKSASGCVE